MSLGTYPEISLREARDLRDKARALLAKGVNPRADRKKQRHVARLAGDNSFDAVYQKWLAHRQLTLEEGRQTSLVQIRRVFTRAHLLEVIERIEMRKSLSVAEKVRTWFGQLFEYATVKIPGMSGNPATSLHAVAVPLPPVQHNPYLRIPELPEFLRTLRKYPGELHTQLAVRLLLLTGVRTGELRWATPDQFDLNRGLWIIPASIVKQLKLRMRKKRLRANAIPPYIVPLSEQAIEIIRYMLAQVRPAQVFLFPSVKCLKRRISENTVNKALKRIGYTNILIGHGIRATISTALNEIGYPKIWVDAQLSHSDPNKISATYDHAQYVEHRRVMMQDWADRSEGTYCQDIAQTSPASSAVVHVSHAEGICYDDICMENSGCARCEVLQSQSHACTRCAHFGPKERALEGVTF